MKYRIFVNGVERPLTEEEKRKITDTIANSLGYVRKQEVKKNDSSK